MAMANGSIELFSSFEYEMDSFFKNNSDNNLNVDIEKESSPLDLEIIKLNKNFSNSLIFQQIYGPRIRGYLLKLSYEAYHSNKILEAIYYQTISVAINISLKYRFGFGEIKSVTKESIQNVYESKTNSNNPLLNYITNSLEKTNDLENANDSINNFINNDPIKGAQIIIDKCSELPKEWIVIQLCKMYNKNQWYSLRKEYYSSPEPLSITLFCYPRSEIYNNQPITFHLHSRNNIYADIFNLPQEIERGLNLKEGNQQQLQLVGSTIDNIIDNMKLWLGPWIVIFSGKIKSPITFEKKLYNEIDKFCDKIYTKRQIVLISLIARRLDLLTLKNINEAAVQISDSGNLEQCNSLNKFFIKLKNSYFYEDNQYYPCILVIDELLDAFYWEMMLPNQELTRISSLTVLFEIYEKYKDSISNGYLKVNLQKGNCVINPDSTLNNMQERMSGFLNYWLPHYNCVFGSIPKKDEMADILTNCDIFIYSGHGSSLQYLSGKSVLQLKINCVAFLLGCESVALRSKGFQNEMVGSHIFLHLAYCPAIIGALTIITDVYTDISATFIFSNWINSKTQTIWKYPNTQLWNKGSQQNKNLLLKLPQNKYCPSLLEVMAKYRNEIIIPIRMRSALICRGLPVYNQSN